MQQMLVEAMIGTLVRLADGREEILAPADRDRMRDPAEPSEARFALVREAFLRVCSSESQRKLKVKERLIDRIVGFIEESFPRPDLNLSMVASAFGLKESYLYHFIREEKGVTFSAHLESHRIERACALLRDASCSVDDVSARVGYSSAHSFRRAFKRCMSVSPSEYQRVTPRMSPTASP
jgi:two-component system response regulator YesN